jgi:peroxiredoxin
VIRPRRQPADLGAAAPQLDLPDATGARRSLTEFRGRPVIVSFLGPSNCAFCRAHVIRAIEARDDIERAGGDVIFVAFNDPGLMMSQMMHDLALPYTLLLDPDRAAYRSWRLGKAGIRSLLTPGLYWAGLKVALRREPSMGDAPDPGQLGGDFVVDREGRLAFVNRMRSFYDRAAMPRLIAALEHA